MTVEFGSDEMVCWLPWAEGSRMGSLRWRNPSQNLGAIGVFNPPPPKPTLRFTELTIPSTTNIPGIVESSWNQWPIEWSCKTEGITILTDIDSKEITVSEGMGSQKIELVWKIEGEQETFTGLFEIEIIDLVNTVYEATNAELLLGKLEYPRFEFTYNKSNSNLKRKLFQWLDGRAVRHFKIFMRLNDGTTIPHIDEDPHGCLTFYLDLQIISKLISEHNLSGHKLFPRVDIEIRDERRSFIIRRLPFDVLEFYHIVPRVILHTDPDELTYEESKIGGIMIPREDTNTGQIIEEPEVCFEFNFEDEDGSIVVDWVDMAYDVEFRGKRSSIPYDEFINGEYPEGYQYTTKLPELKEDMTEYEFRITPVLVVEERDLRIPINYYERKHSISVPFPNRPLHCWGENQYLGGWISFVKNFDTHSSSAVFESLSELPHFPTNNEVKCQLSFREEGVHNSDKYLNFDNNAFLPESHRWLESHPVETEKGYAYIRGTEEEESYMYVTNGVRSRIVLATISIADSISTNFQIKEPFNRRNGMNVPNGHSDYAFGNGQRNRNTALHAPKLEGFQLIIFGPENTLKPEFWSSNPTYSELVEEMNRISNETEIEFKYAFFDVIAGVKDND